ncbi:SMI1/KNR4 family protein [Fibrivirga algicola]|uniref:SMI1/KNR4 family protein n=1 Tax=Fibrivirga algicola TaxID=2950420 RepID=A0ABX0QC83_9BACT|nr:SMI1/KNR4 family protein [Fibrivirga algicola]NID09533.1 SMI1/KNR4 family protein [Fibrivirga algicola]
MNELTSKIHQLKSAVSNAGCLPEEIDKFEDVYGPIDEEYRDFLLWSNGIKFENYELKIPSYNEYKLRVGDDEEFISLYFYHLASLGAVQECIDFANA